MKKKILIVTANYYPKISKKLKESAKEEIFNAFKQPSQPDELVTIDVPGIFEIPVVISQNIDKFDAFIALGCVIKGKTPHFKLISEATINSLMNLSIEYKKPIGNGIITCLNKKQALERADSNKKNKGGEATKAVLSVLGILLDETKWSPSKS